MKEILYVFPFVTGSAQANYYWRDYFSGSIPHDAVEGCGGRYIGQVHHALGDLVANIYPQSETAVTEEQGRVIYTKNIRVSSSSIDSSPYISMRAYIARRNVSIQFKALL